MHDETMRLLTHIEDGLERRGFYVLLKGMDQPQVGVELMDIAEQRGWKVRRLNGDLLFHNATIDKIKPNGR